MNRKIFALVFVIGVLAVCHVSNAAVPPVISYQGKLIQPNGTSVPDGTYPIRFAIYDAPTGGDPLWSETNPSVQVKSGLFAILLGSVNNLGPNILDSANRFLGIKVGDDAEMCPRQRIASVAYALRAGEADNAKSVLDGSITTGKLADEAVTTGKIASRAINGEKIAPASITELHMAPPQLWAAPSTLLNGWRNYGGFYSPAGYYKDNIGIVHLRGLITGGPTYSEVFTLPPGYRPSTQLVFGVESYCKHGRVDVLPDGTVRAVSVYTEWTSLDSISFRSEQ